MNQRWVALASVLVAVLLVAVAAAAQGPILTFTVDPTTVTLPPGGTAGIEIAVQNGSVYTADDIAISASGPDGLSTTPPEADLKVLDPFQDDRLGLTLVAADGLAPGTYDVDLQVVYTYCIDVSCFQIVDTLPVTVVVEAGAVSGHAPSTAGPSPWRWGIPLAAVVVLLVAVGLWIFMRLRVPLYVVLGLVVIGGLGYGVALRQQEQAQGIASVLCTSCVGIEEARHEAPTLSTATVAALEGLREDVHLIVFYAPWCHSCPFAEEMVKEMAAVTPRLTFEFVNVEDNRSLAAANGVIVSERTVVPAIVRSEGGEVVFGIENLQARLLTLLGVGP